MDLKSVLEQLQAERARVNQAIAALEILQGISSAPRRGRPPKNRDQYGGTVVFMPKKRTMSPAARKRISEMMKKRWAERRRKNRAA
jgi:hypothetical protein